MEYIPISRIEFHGPLSFGACLLTVWSSNPSDETVKIVVGTGNKQRTFSITENILVHQSGWFASICDGTWKQAGRNPIEMLDTDPAIFALFRSWILGNDIDSLRADLQDEPLRDIARRELIELYVLAHKTQADRFKDWLVSAAIWVQDLPYFSIENIVLIYAKLPEGSALRKLAVDSWVASSPWRLGQSDYKPFRESHAAAAPDFVLDVMERWSYIEQDQDDPDKQVPIITERVCQYHVHGDDEFCPWNNEGAHSRPADDDMEE